MNVKSFNKNLVETSNDLLNFNKYSNDIIKNNVNGVFKELQENSEKKGYVIPLELLDKYCNFKITGSASLKTIGLNKKDYKKNKHNYYLNFNSFEKCIKEYSKEYQECLKQTAENYANYCQLFYQKSHSNSESEDESDSESDSESEDESDKKEQLIISCPDNIRIYNKELIDGKKNPSIVEYVKELNEKFYNINISFIDDFLKLVGTNECIIPHMMLEKYGVLTIDNSCKINRKLSNFHLVENMGYKKVSAKVGGNLLLGGRPSNKYLLSPYAFKLCLMRSQKTIKYANYFLLLEDCVKYFNDFHLERNLIYRVSLKKLVKQNYKIIKQKDCKIDELKEIMVKMDIRNERIEKKLDDTNTQLIEISRDLKTVISKVSEFKVPRNKQKELSEVIGICKEPITNDGYETYHIVRCQNKYYDTRIKEKYDKYNAVDLFRIDTNNSALCWHSIKQYFSKNNRFVTNTYSFKYKGKIEEDVLHELLSNSVKFIKSQVSNK